MHVGSISRGAYDRRVFARTVSRDAQDRWVLIGLVLIAAGVPVVLAALSGALLLPHDDDFGYRRVASTLYETGRLQFSGWTIMTLVGQIAFTMPFLVFLQGSPWAFAASSVTLAVIGITSSYVLARRLLPAPRAAFSVLLVILFPGFSLVETTFMTDVPAYSAEMLCLAVGAVAVSRTPENHRRRWLVASLVIGCWAFSIREFALAAPIAVLVAATASDPTEPRRRYLFALDAVLAVCVVIYLVAHNLPGQPAIHLSSFARGAVAQVVGGVTTLALMLAPALVLAAATWIPIWRRPTDVAGRRRRVRATIGAGFGMATGVVLAFLFANDHGVFPSTEAGGGTGVILGNVFTRTGALGGDVLAGTRPTLYPAILWTGLEVVAVVAAFACLAGLGAAIGAGVGDPFGDGRLRRRDWPLGSTIGMLATFVTLYAIETVIFGLNGSMHERYLWAVGFPIAVLLLWRPVHDRGPATADRASQRSPDRGDAFRMTAGWIAGAMLGGSAVLSLALLLNAFAFDVARWRIGEAQMANGTPAMSIDAGIEWLGYHATDTADLQAPAPATGEQYTRLWASYHECVVVANSRLHRPGLTPADAPLSTYRTLLFIGQPQPLYVYRSSVAGCPP